MKSMDVAFRQMRMFLIAFLFCLTVVCCYVVYASHAQVNEHKGKIYVMINGSLVEAVARERNIPVELRDHIERFHYYFFTLSPDEKVIQERLQKALYLADGSAKKVYQNLKESGYYNNLIASNISQEFVLDSISVDAESEPYSFKLFSKLIITRPTSVVVRNLITSGVVRTNLSQSVNNVHGFLIERWSIVDNTDIKITER